MAANPSPPLLLSVFSASESLVWCKLDSKRTVHIQGMIIEKSKSPIMPIITIFYVLQMTPIEYSAELFRGDH